MAAVALDLTPVVDVLVERPFDAAALERARQAVGGHPHAYATALRCAAKRTRDSQAAAYWLTEAARVHESVEDLGGAIALLFRAWNVAPGNARTRELLAGCMTRLGVRVGLAFTVGASPAETRSAPDVVADSLPPPRESCMRPSAMGSDLPPLRDTLPDLFGKKEPSPERHPAPASLEPDLRPAPVPTEAPPTLVDVAPPDPVPSIVQARGGHRDALVPPPRDPGGGTETFDPPELAPDLEGDGDETKRSSDLLALVREAARTEPEPVLDDAWGGDEQPRTVRPAGDRLVGALFEALHALHFMDDVHVAAGFIRRVLTEKMRPRVVLVHLYDINTREFLVVSASGGRAEALVGCTTPDDDSLVAEIMRGTEAAIVLEAGTDSRFTRGRWLLVEPKKSVLCAPVSVEGRYLGLIELADPEDGAEFTEDDRNGLTYVANAFARFLAGRGVVLSDDGAIDEALAL
jgi:hypothetical protein